MPATVRSSTSFAAGDLALLAHDFAVADDGFVQARFDFACLGTNTIVARNIARFTQDSRPPVTLPANMAALRLETGTVYLSDKTSRISNGICYITATYVGSSADQARRVTESWTTRTFSGNILGEYYVAGIAIATIWGSISFDYSAVSRTVRWTVIGAQGDVSLNAEPVNKRNRKESELAAGGLTVLKRGKGFMTEQVPSIQTEKIGRVTRIQKTVTGEYVADNDGFKLLRPDRNPADVNLGPLLVG